MAAPPFPAITNAPVVALVLVTLLLATMLPVEINVCVVVKVVNAPVPGVTLPIASV